MKLLAINGSPRPNRNTATLMNLIIDEAKIHNSDLDVMWCNLNDMTYAGCQSCLTCKTSDVPGGVRKDALSFVLDVMVACQVWVIGTPIYMGHVSGQLKLLLDRMYGFTGPNKEKRIPPGKKAIVAVTQGASEESHADVPAQLKSFFTRRGLETQVVRACNLPASAPFPHFDKSIFEEVQRIGKWLIEP